MMPLQYSVINIIFFFKRLIVLNRNAYCVRYDSYRLILIRAVIFNELKIVYQSFIVKIYVYIC